MAALTVSYSCWSSSELVNWIISIDVSYEHKYKQKLTTFITQNGITGKDIDDLDRSDLKEYGIINLEDRKKIYSAIQKLIVNKKRRHSLQQITSLSDDDGDGDDGKEDKLTLLTDIQRDELKRDGYCLMDDPLKNEQIVCAVQGYIRNNFTENCMIPELIRTIINFYNSRYNPDVYVEVICTNLSDDDDDNDNDNNDIEYFLVPKINIELSGVLKARMDSVGNRIEIDIKKVSIDNMRRVLKYLGHHKGIKPAEIAKPIRSVKMERIVEDKWDALYINAFSKKAIFQVILAANYLDCASLLHLGAAKIATLIKGKSPEEIKNILADDGNE